MTNREKICKANHVRLASLLWSSTSSKWSKAMKINSNNLWEAQLEIQSKIPKSSIITIMRHSRSKMISNWPLITKHSSNKLCFRLPNLSSLHNWSLLIKRFLRWRNAKRFSKKRLLKESKRFKITQKPFTCIWKSYNNHKESVAKRFNLQKSK